MAERVGSPETQGGPARAGWLQGPAAGDCGGHCLLLSSRVMVVGLSSNLPLLFS